MFRLGREVLGQAVLDRLLLVDHVVEEDGLVLPDVVVVEESFKLVEAFPYEKAVNRSIHYQASSRLEEQTFRRITENGREKPWQA